MDVQKVTGLLRNIDLIKKSSVLSDAQKDAMVSQLKREIDQITGQVDMVDALSTVTAQTPPSLSKATK